MTMFHNSTASINTLDTIIAALRAGAVPTERMTQRTLAALADLRARKGDDAYRAALARIDAACASRTGVMAPTTKSTRAATPTRCGSRGVTAGRLHLVRDGWLETFHPRRVA